MAAAILRCACGHPVSARDEQRVENALFDHAAAFVCDYSREIIELTMQWWHERRIDQAPVRKSRADGR
jgi:hypothetical protein